MIEIIEIESFRGIPNTLSLNLDGESAILLGSNGSGKSSIIDGIEFCLQAKIQHSADLDAVDMPEVLNKIGNTKKSRIEIKLKDNKVVRRAVEFNNGSYVFDKYPDNRFAYAPFVLRRDDILRFWSTSDVQRQLLFFQYFSYKDKQPLTDDWKQKLKHLESLRLKRKRTRNDLRTKLANIAGTEATEVPIQKNKLHEFSTKYVYFDLSKKQRAHAKWKGIKIRINQKVKIALNEYRKSFEAIDEVNGEISKIKNVPKKHNYKEETKTFFEEVSKEVTRGFLKLTNLMFVNDIQMLIGDISDISITFKVKLSNNEITSPQRVFSEANQDLLALLIFLELNYYSTIKGQEKVLVLDDVLQSVDSEIRTKTIDYILHRFKGWQIIISTHDRLWKEQVEYLKRLHNIQYNCFEILRWSENEGPMIISNIESIDDYASDYTKNITELCSSSSILLEKICNNLSYRLPISVTRRRNDKYTIGDLWPGIRKILKKTNLDNVSEEIDHVLYLRNIIGGHYNNWAQNISRNEALRFKNAIIKLHNSVYCNECRKWIELLRVGEAPLQKWSCRCQKLIVQKKYV
ncbi:MAG: AAA family ATPase [Eubacteriales bacterium]